MLVVDVVGVKGCGELLPSNNSILSLSVGEDVLCRNITSESKSKKML